MSYLIKTQYFGPTNVRGARIKASSALFRESVTIDYPHELIGIRCYEKAARALADKIDARLQCRSADPEFIESGKSICYFISRGA